MTDKQEELKGKNPPRELQGVLWSSSVEKVDLWEHKAYIIHQVLRYGSFANIRWLFEIYGKELVVDVFITQPFKIYTAEAFNYIKNLVLELKGIKLSSSNYVSTVHDRI